MGPVLIIRGSTGHDTGVQMAKAAAVVYEAMMDKISSIHKAIKSIGEINYADPDLYKSLPFTRYPAATAFLVTMPMERI